MQKMVHVSEVAALARKISRKKKNKKSSSSSNLGNETTGASSSGSRMTTQRGMVRGENLATLLESADAADEQEKGDDMLFHNDGAGAFNGNDDEWSSSSLLEQSEKMKMVVDPDEIDEYTGSLNSSQRARIGALLGEWEEPDQPPSTIPVRQLIYYLLRHG